MWKKQCFDPLPLSLATSLTPTPAAAVCRLAKRAVFDGMLPVQTCINESRALDAGLADHISNCSLLPAPCGGRGTCNDDYRCGATTA